VIEAVKRASGQDFTVHMADRRAGDPAELVASSKLIRDELGWTPEYDDLDLNVKHALAWEEKLNSLRKAS
jgi:UDP-glucose 4-epimerase